MSNEIMKNAECGFNIQMRSCSLIHVAFALYSWFLAISLLRKVRARVIINLTNNRDRVFRMRRSRCRVSCQKIKFAFSREARLSQLGCWLVGWFNNNRVEVNYFPSCMLPTQPVLRFNQDHQVDS